MNGWNAFTMPSTFRFEHRAKRRQVFRVIGARATRNAGVGDDDTRRAETLDEIAARMRERRGIANVAGIRDDTRGRNVRRDARELGIAPREESDGCT